MSNRYFFVTTSVVSVTINFGWSSPSAGTVCSPLTTTEPTLHTLAEPPFSLFVALVLRSFFTGSLRVSKRPSKSPSLAGVVSVLQFIYSIVLAVRFFGYFSALWVKAVALVVFWSGWVLLDVSITL